MIYAIKAVKFFNCFICPAKIKKAAPFGAACTGRTYLRHFRSQYRSPTDIPKLTQAPVAASIMVLAMSPELILTSNMVITPPRIPYFEWPVMNGSVIRYFFSIFTAVWLTLLITPPATAK